FNPSSALAGRFRYLSIARALVWGRWSAGNGARRPSLSEVVSGAIGWTAPRAGGRGRDDGARLLPRLPAALETEAPLDGPPLSSASVVRIRWDPVPIRCISRDLQSKCCRPRRSPQRRPAGLQVPVRHSLQASLSFCIPAATSRRTVAANEAALHVSVLTAQVQSCGPAQA